MKSLLAIATLVAGSLALAACADQPVQRVAVARPDDPNAYEPVPQPKPLPPDGYAPGQVPPPQGYPQQPPPGQPGASPSGGGNGVLPSIANEDAFVAAYAQHRSPRMMVWVNRSIQGDPLPKEGLEEKIRIENTQSATGGVNVSNNHSYNANGQETTAGYAGSSASNVNINKNNSSSFSSNGPADYKNTTSVKVAPSKYDEIDATSADYDAIETSVVQYFDNSGRVHVADSEAARGKLDREKELRIENGDNAVIHLLNTELQQDVLIRITATPTKQSIYGNGVRLNAKAISTTNARILGAANVDMPLPMSQTNINISTRHLTENLMASMAHKWAAPPEYDPIEVRIYKAASIDDSLKIRKWLQQTKGVSNVLSRGATGSSTTSYAIFAVAYTGAPEDLYADLKDAIGASQGLKAVDLQNNTINLEVTGTLNLVTTTRKTETMTTTEVHTTEEKTIEPINPAPPQN